MLKIIFATGNQDKMREIREILSDPQMEILSMREAGIETDAVEDGKTFEENALIKARAVAGKLQGEGWVVLADDSGLEVDYLNKEPGIYSARYMGEDTSYDIKNQNILDRLAGVPKEQRTARFVCAIAAAFPDGEAFTTRGTIEGYSGWEPAGDDWWVPATEEGLADTCWVCDGWSLNLLGGGGDPDYAGIAELYCQFEDGQEYQLLYSGVWRMVDDCLQLIVSTGAGNLPSDASGVFPVLIDPSGNYLHIQQDRDNGMRPLIIDDDMSSMELIRSYG